MRVGAIAGMTTFGIGINIIVDMFTNFLFVKPGQDHIAGALTHTSMYAKAQCSNQIDHTKNQNSYFVSKLRHNNFVKI
jgi:hypothetical protein